MTNPTTPFNWQMPTSTDLVTDLPADFETFGQAVATSMADLLGGTTGQILSKASNTDMDFTWVTNDVGDITAVTAGTGISGGGTSGAVTITNSMATEIAAKGDLIVGTGSATFDNLGVGTNGQVLTADSTVSPTGLKWATPTAAASGLTYITGTSFSGVSNVSLPNDTFTSTYTNYLISFTITSAAGAIDFGIRGRTSGTDLSTSVYDYAVNGGKTNSTTYTFGGASADRMYVSSMTAGTPSRFTMNVFSPQTTDNTYISTTGIGTESSLAATANAMGIARSSAQFDSLTFIPGGISITGFYRVYGIANS